MSYVDMAKIVLGLIRASREGNWMLHLTAIGQMIPWCFAYDKVNYAWFLTYYYATMSRLPIEHPEVHAHIMQGGFSVQIGSHNSFGRIPVDQTIEDDLAKRRTCTQETFRCMHAFEGGGHFKHML